MKKLYLGFIIAFALAIVGNEIDVSNVLPHDNVTFRNNNLMWFLIATSSGIAIGLCSGYTFWVEDKIQRI